MNIKCEKCGNQWVYKGRSKWYLTCPKCKNIVNINEMIKQGRDKKQD